MEAGTPRNFASAARVAADLVARLIQGPPPDAMILNVNVPDLPEGGIRGLRVTRLGNRHRSEPVVRAQDPRGKDVYWVGGAGAGQDAGPGTDFDAVANGYVSITPLQIDLTRHAAIPSIERWLERG
jgi:5'-nucleotidase